MRSRASPDAFPSGERVKESSPPSFRTSGAATAVTENNRRELFHPRRRAVSCEAALRILSNGEACPPGGGDSGMTMVWGLLSFVLKAVAGACVGRWTGQPRMPPRERQHEGL